MKPNIFIEGPRPKFRVHGETDPKFATEWSPVRKGLWYLDLSQGRDVAIGFMYNATTKELTELRLPEIIDLLKFSDF
jgi:hypothetical protein